MEIGKYLNLILINSIFILNSCNWNNKTVAYTMLEDISSNCYYIPINIEHEDMRYEVVIPNDRLFFILYQEYGEGFNLQSYFEMVKPILQENEVLNVNKNIFEEIYNYVLHEDWRRKSFDLSDLFENNIQKRKVNQELVLIRYLFDLGYIVYKDDETGLLVKSKYDKM